MQECFGGYSENGSGIQNVRRRGGKDCTKGDILGQLPINPALAEACDKGEVETALPDGMLPKAVSAVEAITPHETDEA